jgi:hypothetical protein
LTPKRVLPGQALILGFKGDISLKIGHDCSVRGKNRQDWYLERFEERAGKVLESDGKFGNQPARG